MLEHVGGGLARGGVAAAQVLRQRADERGDQLEPPAGHLPVEAGPLDGIEERQRHVDDHAVEVRGGIEHVGQRQPGLAERPRLREVGQIGDAGGGVDEVGRPVGEPVGIVALGLRPPGAEPSGGGDVVGYPGVEERHQLVVADEEVAPHALLEGDHVGDPLVVGAARRRGGRRPSRRRRARGAGTSPALAPGRPGRPACGGR